MISPLPTLFCRFPMGGITVLLIMALCVMPALSLAQQPSSGTTEASGPADTAILLTATEKEWLAAHGHVLKYCYGPTWKPYDYRENGHHKGVFHDYLKLFSRKLGIAFKPVHTETWQQTLDAARERRCDLVSGAVDTPSRRDYLAFTTPYFQVVHVLVALEKTPFVTGIDALLDKTIAVPRNAAIIEILRKRHPGLKLVEYEGLDELRKLLDAKKVYAAIAGLEYAAEIINEDMGRYRIIGKLDDKYPISVAVRNDQPPLFNIMQKTVESLTQADRDTISKRWTTFTIREQVDYRLLWQVLGVVLVAALFLLYRQRQLNLFNRELMKEKEKAEAANRAKSLFLANMSHEIRTPLNAVINLAQFGLDASSEPRIHGYFQGIADSGRTLLGIINEVLDYSKLESAKMPLETRPFDIHEVVKQAVAVVRPLAEAKGLELKWEADERLRGHWLGDPLKIEQILINLAGNAVKFTAQGSIFIKAVHYMQVGNETVVRFSVQDTGIGMSNDEVERLFQPFEQADSSTTRKYGGTGLGLAIVRKLVDMMEGAIGVNSSKGEGSCFYFDLPLQPAPKTDENRPINDDTGAKPLPARPASSRPPDTPARVLVAEDNELNQIILGELLQPLGVEFDMVNDGRKAVEQLRRRPDHYAALLLDVQMPVMDGFEAARQIRADSRFASLPIIAITAHALESDKRECLAAGMNDFLTKPFDQGRFKAVLAQTLGLNMATPGIADLDAGLKWAEGNPALFHKLVGEFVRVYENRERLLVSSTGADELHALLHDLKGNARVVGAEALGDKAGKADEALGKEGCLPQELLDELRSDLSRLLAQLREFLDTSETSAP